MVCVIFSFFVIVLKMFWMMKRIMNILSVWKSRLMMFVERLFSLK